jgi:hypothetical protein
LPLNKNFVKKQGETRGDAERAYDVTQGSVGLDSVITFHQQIIAHLWRFL